MGTVQYQFTFIYMHTSIFMQCIVHARKKFLKLVGNVESYIERQNTFFIQRKIISHRFDVGLAKGSVPSVCTYSNYKIEQITSEHCLVEESAHAS